ncbi:MAG: hypothetical protein ACWGKN_07925 [Desulfoprunum sp.]
MSNRCVGATGNEKGTDQAIITQGAEQCDGNGSDDNLVRRRRANRKGILNSWK